jgi:hypothetical protein
MIMASTKRASKTALSAATALRASVSASHKATKAKSPGIATYEREVRRELEKKIGKGNFPADVYSTAYMTIVERAFKNEVHPVATAGVLTIASGLAPEKAPSGLCCGQR